jgi:hypothetical protein
MNTTPDDLRLFIHNCETEITINFPWVAKQLDIPYKKIQAQLAMKSWFYEEMDLMLQRLKFMLVDSAFKAGINGKSSRRGDVASAKFIIQLIDSGSLLESVTPQSEDSTDGDVEAALSQLEKGKDNASIPVGDNSDS